MEKVSLQRFKKMTPKEVSALKINEMRSLVNQGRAMASKRLRTFEKNPSVFSYAVDKLSDYYEEGMGDIKKKSRNQLMQEVFRLQEFFNSKTSTITGSRAVAREQDIRIFGAAEDGKPKSRMTREQRERYWSLYDEFLNQKKNAYFIFTSDKIQQYLGEMVVKGASLSLSSDNIENIYNQLEARKWSGESVDTAGNVYSGKGNA